MNRGIQYPSAIPLSADILGAQQNSMIGLGALLQAAFGTGTYVNGLAATQTTVPSMTINIGPGSIISLEEVDPSAYSTLGTNTAPLVKQGINLTATQFTLAAPATSGQSINYLIEAEFLEQDGTPVVLPYVNPSSPSTPYAGPNNTGVAQNTVRSQTVSLQLKAGVAATTGTQTTPATDAGWVPLYVITVNYGQTAITTGQITQASGAPIIPFTLPALTPGFSRIQVLTSSTSFTVPPGVTRLKVSVMGGGGGGGGSYATTSSQVSASNGASSAALGVGVFTVTPGQVIPVTVGAGGNGGAIGTAGTAGGTSSFGALISSPGATAGLAVVASAPPYAVPVNSPSNSTTGGAINGSETTGESGLALSLTQALGGCGAGSIFGGGAGNNISSTGNGPGTNAGSTVFGSGGSGACSFASNPGYVGGNGAPGVVILEY